MAEKVEEIAKFWQLELSQNNYQSLHLTNGEFKHWIDKFTHYKIDNKYQLLEKIYDDKKGQLALFFNAYGAKILHQLLDKENLSKHTRFGLMQKLAEIASDLLAN